jgi:hypothetical protein
MATEGTEERSIINSICHGLTLINTDSADLRISGATELRDGKANQLIRSQLDAALCLPPSVHCSLLYVIGQPTWGGIISSILHVFFQL